MGSHCSDKALVAKLHVAHRSALRPEVEQPYIVVAAHQK
jgi:hypothetical protein